MSEKPQWSRGAGGCCLTPSSCQASRWGLFLHRSSLHLPCPSTRHLQDSLGRLWENKCLTVRTCEQHHTCEQLKASRIPSTAWPGTGPGQQLCAYRGGWAMAELPLLQHGPETGWLRPPGQYNSVPCPRIYRGTTGQCQPHMILHGCLHPALASRTRRSAKQSQIRLTTFKQIKLFLFCSKISAKNQSLPWQQAVESLRAQ